MRFPRLFGTALAIFVLSFLNSACDSSNYRFALDATPLLWVSENELLVGDANAVRLYDLSKGKIIRTVYEADNELGKLDFLSFCMSKDRWVLHQVKDISDGKGGHTFQNRWHHIGWLDATNSTIEISQQPQRMNPFDCQPIDTVFPFSGDMQTSYDAQTGLYFRYLTTRTFEKSRAKSAWPLKGSWVASDRTIRSSIDLPAGPWVGEYGTFKSLSCGGCGCECFTYIRFYPANGRIFAVIWGRGVIDGETGIYELMTPSSNANWKRLAAEPTEKFNPTPAFSPSGCKLAYYSTRLKILNVCSNKT